MEDPKVRTLQTAVATIKFTGGMDDGSSDSESGPEEDHSDGQIRDEVTVIKSSPDVIDNQNKTNNNLLNNKTSANETQVDSSNGNALLQPNLNENGSARQTRVTAEPSPQPDASENSNKTEEGQKLTFSEPQRFNPFDKEEYDPHEKLFPQSDEATSPGRLDSTTSSSSWPDSPDIESHIDSLVTNAELGISEDHFGLPEGHFGLSTVEELEMAINNCKTLILSAQEHTERRRSLVTKLVQLRLKLTEAKEGPEEPDPGVKQVVGHHFEEKEAERTSKHYCEKCNSVIWGVLHTWYRCRDCGFCCHAKCLNLITRTCAIIKVAENPSYILSISPEKGLSQQNYRCAECKKQISFQAGYGEPRQCDYTGSYYCDGCHWNNSMIIPARVVHNWDFEPRKVCRASKQFLKLIMRKPVIRVQDINPMLFNFVEELIDVKKLREEILIMKKYFLTCKAALESKLLLQLRERQHFVEASDQYSLQDLIDVANDVLLPEIAKIHASFAQHIKTDCPRCQGQGYICELCDYEEVLFPFDNHAIVCAQCSTVLHRHCYMRRNQRCPKCDRINKRIQDAPSSSGL